MVDGYEEAAKGPEFAAAAAAALPVGDDFRGQARKAAKLSISTAKTENFKDVSELVKSLPPDSKMIAHKPAIATTATSGRVKEEERNVHVSAPGPSPPSWEGDWRCRKFCAEASGVIPVR